MTWFNLRLAPAGRPIAPEVWRLLWDGAPPNEAGAAVFARRDGAPTAFFTPAARQFALAFGAEPCLAPAAAEVTLVAGDQQALAMHLREGGGLARAAAVSAGIARAMTWWMPRPS